MKLRRIHIFTVISVPQTVFFDILNKQIQQYLKVLRGVDENLSISENFIRYNLQQMDSFPCNIHQTHQMYCSRWKKGEQSKIQHFEFVEKPKFKKWNCKTGFHFSKLWRIRRLVIQSRNWCRKQKSAKIRNLITARSKEFSTWNSTIPSESFQCTAQIFEFRKINKWTNSGENW